MRPQPCIFIRHHWRRCINIEYPSCNAEQFAWDSGSGIVFAVLVTRDHANIWFQHGSNKKEVNNGYEIILSNYQVITTVFSRLYIRNNKISDKCLLFNHLTLCQSLDSKQYLISILMHRLDTFTSAQVVIKRLKGLIRYLSPHTKR